MSYEILHCEHVDDDTGEYKETELWEIRDVDTGDVDDCCLDDEQIIPYENDMEEPTKEFIEALTDYCQDYYKHYDGYPVEFEYKGKVYPYEYFIRFIGC